MVFSDSIGESSRHWISSSSDESKSDTRQLIAKRRTTRVRKNDCDQSESRQFLNGSMSKAFVSPNDTPSQDYQSQYMLATGSDNFSMRMPQSRTQRTRSRSRLRLPLFLTYIAPLLLLLLSSFQPVSASQGDRSPEYQRCVDSCDRDSCLVGKNWDDGTAKATILPMILRMTFWTCFDDCKYHCTHRVTNEAHERVTHIRQDAFKTIESASQKNGWSKSEQRRLVGEIVQGKLGALRPVQKEMVQYHGKWVFIRLFGAQEPLSVLFSVANFYVHLSALDRLRKQVPDAFPLKLVYILHALVSCFAWLWSAIFHTRDKPFTERMDYFSAGAVVLGGLFYAICRLLRIGPGSVAFKILVRTFSGALTLHILYLSFGRFDYSYNMKANILVGVSNSLLWLTYSFKPELFSSSGYTNGRFDRLRSSPQLSTGSISHIHHNGGSPPVPVSTPNPLPPSSSRKSKRQLQLILALLWLATLLEVLDFPPIWRALDAHALWHAATVPIARMWYTWLIEDARECTSTGFWTGDLDAKTAAYLQIPHKTEEAVENVTRAVGPPMMRAVERAREWVETAAVKTADKIGNGMSGNGSRDSLGTSSGIEFKALTNKLNELARGTLGNGKGEPVLTSSTIPIDGLSSNSLSANATSKSHGRTGSAHARTSSVNIGSRGSAV